MIAKTAYAPWWPIQSVSVLVMLAKMLPACRSGLSDA
jgi:hypothetical protein